MFLKDLKEKPQRILFLELAALIMMAEGSQSMTSEKIQRLEPQSKRYAIIPKLDSESKKYKCFQTLESEGKRYVFLQNIDENKMNTLDTYAKELEIKYVDDLFPLYSRNNVFELMNVLEKEIAAFLINYDQLGEDFRSTITNVKNYILERTADELISIRKKSISHLNSKEKKIVLLGLVRAGYSSRYFEDRGKSLLLHICKSLDIEIDYIDEFIEISERLFSINIELETLINE
ncbi:hypothetical protein AOT82_1957 [Psychrobacter sp. AntiMn-1]|uniref:hypothetical protein n=1 Tax=Psychrobacter sp. AntiMn-1 TaxID=1720344 RepID=UPI0008A684EF|nr:hypothetical protein [Psychrobacter sp. AntiMn-1]AOY44336.1 hypothetical protein AOT82_1957 [Psychrobacter sp. AntiMn-1]